MSVVSENEIEGEENMPVSDERLVEFTNDQLVTELMARCKFAFVAYTLDDEAKKEHRASMCTKIRLSGTALDIMQFFIEIDRLIKDEGKKHASEAAIELLKKLTDK